MGPRYGEGLTMLSDLFLMILEDSRKEAEEGVALENLLRDEAILRRLWKQGKDIDWDRKDFDYRYLELTKEDLAILICKMVGGGGHVVVTAGIFEQRIIKGDVDPVGLTPDNKLDGFRHVGRFKDHRGSQGDVFWRLLIQTGEEVRGSLLSKKYDHRLNEVINAIKDKTFS